MEYGFKPNKDIIGKGLIVHQGTDDFVSHVGATLVLSGLFSSIRLF
jgi:hypothetical protein